eukprot:10292472-Alexandrium_andersonii.AAC.1
MEVRHTALRPGWRWLAWAGRIWARARFGPPLAVDDDACWARLRARHLWDVHARPYATTFALPIVE